MPIQNAPKKIFLQVGDDLSLDEDINFKDLGEVSWADQRIYPSDIEYVISTSAEQLTAEAGAFYTPEQIRQIKSDAWDASGDFNNECFCGTCDYCKMTKPSEKAIDKETYLNQTK